MSKIINLTQHVATVGQQAGGVVEPALKERVQDLLTFKALPSRADIEARAVALASLASLAKLASAEAALIGGAPYLMGDLERALRAAGVMALYSYTERQSVEELSADGQTVVKRQIFEHAGFIPAWEEEATPAPAPQYGWDSV